MNTKKECQLEVMAAAYSAATKLGTLEAIGLLEQAITKLKDIEWGPR